MRWSATLLNQEPRPAAPLEEELFEFVFRRRAVEAALDPLDVPATCGSRTCGVDCAIVRAPGGALAVRLLEVNARTTMSHYALAARRRVPGAIRFAVVPLSEAIARPGLVLLTDAASATRFCAVLEVGSGGVPRAVAAAGGLAAVANEACGALTRLLRPSCGREPPSPGDASALLATVWLPTIDAASGGDEASGPVRAVRGHSLRLLRAEAARLESSHAAAVAFGRSGVRVSVHAIAAARLGPEASFCDAAGLEALRMGADAAAALADLVAGAGANKAAALSLGGVEALLAAVEQHEAFVVGRRRARAGEGAERAVEELCVQARVS